MNMIGKLLLISVIIVLVSICISLTVSYMELLEKYQWAMELSQIGLEERKEIIMKIKDQILI